MLTFQKLWENHPSVSEEDDNPCTTNGKINFSNQCAMHIPEQGDHLFRSKVISHSAAK